MEAVEITPGIYRHFKGGIYEVLGVGRHSETEEWLVIYKNPSGDFGMQPYSMFFDIVLHENAQVQRFILVEQSKH